MATEGEISTPSTGAHSVLSCALRRFSSSSRKDLLHLRTASMKAMIGSVAGRCVTITAVPLRRKKRAEAEWRSSYEGSA